MSYYGGITCCLGAAMFYLISRSYKGEGDFLKSVIRINRIKDLSDLLDTACNAVVTFTGKIGSDTPIKCKYSDRLAVFLEEWVKQPYRRKCKTCNKDNKWADRSVSKVIRSEVVPWYLGDGTGRVSMGNDHEYGLYRASKIIERPDLSLVNKIDDECATCGEDLKIKILESQRIEDILPVGRSLTVIGEAVKDNKGAIKIQPTKNGSFYASSTSIDERINHAEWGESSAKFTALVLAGIGVILIAVPTIRYISGKLRARFLQRSDIKPAFESLQLHSRSQRSAATERIFIIAYHRSMTFPSAPMLNEKNDVSPNAEQDLVHDTCVVCQEQEYNMVFVPCGHLCCCRTCSSLLTECPLCRKNISEAVRTYRP
ncbi:RING-type E3 ubiquitin transferase [Ranunculus cassubicifolius]